MDVVGFFSLREVRAAAQPSTKRAQGKSRKVNGGKFLSEVSRTVRDERQKIDHVVSPGPRNIQNDADFVVTKSWITATFRVVAAAGAALHSPQRSPPFRAVYSQAV
jgi:hypothetical protein